MAPAKRGDAVKIHFTVKLQDGTQVGSSVGGEPVALTIGAGDFMAVIEEAVIDMSPGDTKTISVPPEQAFGPRHDELVQIIDRSELPAGEDPQVGTKYQIVGPDKRPWQLIVTAVEGSAVTLDANHPLAGETLTFDIELLAMA